MMHNVRHSISAKVDRPPGKAQQEIHHAGWIVAHKDLVVENGYLIVQNGFVQSIQKKKPAGPVIDHGPGALMPALVNTHLHLELSALYGQVSMDNGFRQWVAQLLEKRTAIGLDALVRGIKTAIEFLEVSGNLAIGDISTLGITHDLIVDSRLAGVAFHEFIGSEIPAAEIEISPESRLSFAGHAPHTTAPDVLKYLKTISFERSLPFSIHVSESEDEMEFIRTQKGSWAEFLCSRGIDFSSWHIKGKTPMEHINRLGLLDSLSIVVHALRMDRRDFEILKKSGSHVCVCPRSNLNLHGVLPDINSMIRFGIRPSLGTDSLASCESLDILDEMRFVKMQYPSIPDNLIFEMGTLNGARALMIDQQLGSLESGKRAQMIYLPLIAGSSRQLFEKMVTYE